MKFSETLIDVRKEKNLSQQQLANATGLSRSAIAKSEKGRNEATASTLLRLSRFFKVSVDEMLSETERHTCKVLSTPPFRARNQN